MDIDLEITGHAFPFSTSLCQGINEVPVNGTRTDLQSRKSRGMNCTGRNDMKSPIGSLLSVIPIEVAIADRVAHGDLEAMFYAEYPCCRDPLQFSWLATDTG